MPKKRMIVVGAGLAGATVARLVVESVHDIEVLIIEKRRHIGGNCYDEVNSSGHRIHRYGPHYFRTNSIEVLNFLSQFTKWHHAEYRIQSYVEGKFYPFPISLATMQMLKGRRYSSTQFQNYINDQKTRSTASPKNAEEQVISLTGNELYRLFYKGYTEKQWGCSAKKLSPEITARIPLRKNFNHSYVNETFQVMPSAGFTNMISNMLRHSRIHVFSQTTFHPNLPNSEKGDYLVYTGELDRFCRYEYGPLKYRSLRFEFETFPQMDFYQDCVQINYPNEYNYTRIVETKHIQKELYSGTTICREYPAEKGDPFYPVLDNENKEKFRKYESLMKNYPPKIPTFFIGRLANFQYYNMDQIILKAITLAKKRIIPLLSNSTYVNLPYQDRTRRVIDYA